MTERDKRRQTGSWARRFGSVRRPDTDGIRWPCLTIAAHPDPDRVGERAILRLSEDEPVGLLSRLIPGFALPSGSPRRPLLSGCLSRTPFQLVLGRHGALMLVRPLGKSTPVTVNGVPLGDHRHLTRVEVEQGVALLIAESVSLVLHRARAAEVRAPAVMDLLGHSDALEDVRWAMDAAARTGASAHCEVPPLVTRREDVPVLMRALMSREAARLGRAMPDVPAPVMDALVRHEWPDDEAGAALVARELVASATGGCDPEAIARRVGPQRSTLYQLAVAPTLLQSGADPTVGPIAQGDSKR